MAKNTHSTKHNTSLTQIQRYLNGEMSAEEMHNLEMQALENQMLAEAIEGLEMVKTKSQNLVEIELQKRLKKRIQNNRKQVFSLQSKLIAMAAMVLLLICATFIFRFYEKQEAQNENLSQIAQNSAQEKIESPTVSPIIEEKENLKKTEITEKKYAEKKITSTDSELEEQDLAINDQKNDQNEKMIKEEMATVADLVENQETVEKTIRNLSKDENRSILAEKKEMKILEDDSMADQMINDQKNKRSDSNIAKKRKKEQNLDISVGKNEPKPLKNDFNKYLQDSLRYPNTNLEGTVELEFLVNKKGKLSDIQVVKSLSSECDAEAIRLLKAGGDWKLLKKNLKKARISIIFKRSK